MGPIEADAAATVRWRWVPLVGVLLIAVPLVAATLSFLASLVPDRLILDSLVDGVGSGAIRNVPQVGISGRGVDVFSDCIAMTMGLGDTDGGATTIWLRSPTLGSCDGAIDSIVRYRDGQGLSGGYEYFRYWHGYTVVSRPLLAVVGVSGLRIVLFWAYLAVLALFARRLWRWHGAVAPVALLAPFLLTSDTVELARSLPHGLPALVGLAGALAVHVVSTRPAAGSGGSDRDAAVAVTAFLAGAAYVYVDVLTTPPGVWALTIVVGMLAVTRFRDAAGIARRGALVGGAWLAGWVWTWVTKWAIAAAVLGADRVRSSIGDAVEDRLVGERDYIDLGVFNAIEANLRMWWEHPLTPPVVLVVLIAAIVTVGRSAHRGVGAVRLVLALPALIPLVWFEVLRNHSLVHFRFVYRSLGVSAGIVALALLIPPWALRRIGRSSDGAASADPGEAVPRRG